MKPCDRDVCWHYVPITNTAHVYLDTPNSSCSNDRTNKQLRQVSRCSQWAVQSMRLVINITHASATLPQERWGPQFYSVLVLTCHTDQSQRILPECQGAIPLLDGEPRMLNVPLRWLHGSAGPTSEHSQGRKCISNMRLANLSMGSPALPVLHGQRSDQISQIKLKQCPDSCSCQGWIRLDHPLQQKGPEVVFSFRFVWDLDDTIGDTSLARNLLWGIWDVNVAQLEQKGNTIKPIN